MKKGIVVKKLYRIMVVALLLPGSAYCGGDESSFIALPRYLINQAYPAMQATASAIGTAGSAITAGVSRAYQGTRDWFATQKDYPWTYYGLPALGLGAALYYNSPDLMTISPYKQAATIGAGIAGAQLLRRYAQQPKDRPHKAYYFLPSAALLGSGLLAKYYGKDQYATLPLLAGATSLASAVAAAYTEPYSKRERFKDVLQKNLDRIKDSRHVIAAQEKGRLEALIEANKDLFTENVIIQVNNNYLLKNNLGYGDIKQAYDYLIGILDDKN